ncbi:hypothetical protein [Neptunomonas antarctica]|uniref:Uncharacterized protein n=1 Tax=Neptunomonas antarctica TaxID=619304 RepID=A0A1N7MXX4_9GAMM|nr:hypothetical protein [Neptunomonas antarctica]SIS90963.1 hypothetical protein SAMN05421760_107105 [Neptunomonas antarctica]
MTRSILIEKRPEKLFRYSKRKWLEKSLYEGEFRLVSATYIKSLQGDAPRQDDEMCFELSLPQEDVDITCLTTGRPIIPSSNVIITDELETDYFMLCLSIKKDSYLFDEFKESDSCLIIHDPNEFSERIFQTSELYLKNWVPHDARVIYGQSSQHGPSYSKPFKYLFQHEWRFCWLPLMGRQSNLECLTIKIGNIEDIAELVDRF